jgi:hypothetical protein
MMMMMMMMIMMTTQSKVYNMIFIYYSNYLPHQLRFNNIQEYFTLGTGHT